MKKLLPVILAVVGLGAGIGAGVLLKASADPAAKPAAEAAAPDKAKAGAKGAAKADDVSATDLVKLDNQFVVPVIDEAEVSALVVLSLNLEVDPGQAEAVYDVEPKLRDAFLRVLFEHSNAGGFHGSFTSSGTMNLLRAALRESAERTLGDIVHEVLITNIVRQRV